MTALFIIEHCLYKSAINNANSPLGHNIVYFRNNYDIDFDICLTFNKFIEPLRLCEKKRLIIAQLNNLLLVK